MKRTVPNAETPQVSQRSWVSVLVNDVNNIGVDVAGAAAFAGASKIAGMLHKPPESPPPPPVEVSRLGQLPASIEESE